MPPIALLCPTKERLERKNTLINSIINTVSSKDNITLYLGIDSYGDYTLEKCKKLSERFPFIKVIELDPKAHEYNMHKFWNSLARKAIQDGHEILGLIADDFVFRTQNWDLVIQKEFTELLPSDKIKLVTCNDLHQQGRIPVNGFLHKRYVDITGWFVEDYTVSNWCDNWWLRTFKAFNRYVYRPDIIIEHQHWVFSGNGPDKIGQEIVERQGKNQEKSDQIWSTLQPAGVAEIKKIAEATGLIPDFRAGEFDEKYWT